MQSLVGLLKAKLRIVTDKKILHYIEEKERKSNVKKENSSFILQSINKCFTAHVLICHHTLKTEHRKSVKVINHYNS